MQHAIEQHGFAIVPEVISRANVDELLSALGPATAPGRRGLLSLSAVTTLARSERFLRLVSPFLPGHPFPVRTIYFDKSPDTNWLVSWHQDLTLALRSYAEAPGFGPWSVKDGIPHVQPPVELLGHMLTVRLHLDDTDESNGALRVLPGTHLHGRISPDQIPSFRSAHDEFVCEAAAGDAMLMRPLLLHASGRSKTARHRRILHIEYASFALPAGLEWHEAA